MGSRAPEGHRRVEQRQKALLRERSIDSMAHRLEIATCVPALGLSGEFLRPGRMMENAALLHAALEHRSKLVPTNSCHSRTPPRLGRRVTPSRWHVRSKYLLQPSSRFRPRDGSGSRARVPGGQQHRACHTPCADSSSRLVRSFRLATRFPCSSCLASRRKRSAIPSALTAPWVGCPLAGSTEYDKRSAPSLYLAGPAKARPALLSAGTPPESRVPLHAKRSRARRAGTVRASILHWARE